ncbi:MAG: hypothetical protein AABW81_01415 [Nanoarchaeota archaeon]
MKFLEIFDNLTDYNSPILNIINIEGRKYKTKLDYKPSLSLGFSFGENNHNTKYNPTLAQTIKDAEIKFSKIPILLQYEVWESFKKDEKLGNNIYLVGDKYEVCPKGTKEVLEMMIEIADKEGLIKKSPLYTTHPAQAFRTLEIGKKLGLEGYPFIKADVQWPSKNIHTSFVRSPKKWAKREIMVRVHHKLKGWI